MSIASPTALIRRAAALPMGLLDRIDAGLDNGFTRVDRALERRIQAVTDSNASIAHSLASSAQTLDRALDQRLTESDSRSAARTTWTLTKAERIGSFARECEDRVDAKLTRGLHKVDRATEVGIHTAVATVNASIALTHRADNQITRGFNRADLRVTNFANRAHRRQAKTLNLAHRTTLQIDQSIETQFLRADARISAGLNRVVAGLETAGASAVSIASGTDTRLTNAISHLDTQLDRRIAQGATAATSTFNLVNANALAFERAIDFGIARVDSRIASGAARGVAASVAITNGVKNADVKLSGALAGVDARLDHRIAKVANAQTQAASFASSRIDLANSSLENLVTASDGRVTTSAKYIGARASAVSGFVVDRIDNVDTALTTQMSRIDVRADALIDLANGNRSGSKTRSTNSLPWAATSLTLLIGTLGAATGASVVNANSIPAELDKSVQIEASAAKDAVSQYLSVRDSFQALQASRSRSMQTLEQEIAAAEVRASQASIDGAKVIDIANNYGGVPYVRGGTTPSGFDCSGYTSYVFAQMGITLPRVASAQYNWADKISAKERKPGDLMFWANSAGVHHVAIYAGDGKMWDATRPGRSVAKIDIWGTPSYGRVPIEAINAPALREIKAKTAELEKLKANPPQLPITIDENLLPTTNPELVD